MAKGIRVKIKTSSIRSMENKMKREIRKAEQNINREINNIERQIKKGF